MSVIHAFVHRAARVAVVSSIVVAGLAMPAAAAAQTRAALVRDTDNPALAPVTYASTANVSGGGGGVTTITTVPAGKRLVIENIAYSAGSANGTQVVSMELAAANNFPYPLSQFRSYIPINPPHQSNDPRYVLQDGSFVTKIYFEAGEPVILNVTFNTLTGGNSLSYILTGYLVTP